MLYKLLHKRCVSFLQYIPRSLFLLVRIVLMQVSHVFSLALLTLRLHSS